ncbi:hypothetical protein SFGR64A_30155 (plasmid) [Sinorhizobium fredii GR64]|nr:MULTISPECIES: hypothetical protein [Sinorhizobium]WOS67064.1 hypothetical protein SFGR64A_30155 [Sinorhizobium fredii GR64]
MRKAFQRLTQMQDFIGRARGKEAKLVFMGQGLMENRHGLLVDACLTEPSGCRTVATLQMIESFTDRSQAAAG